MKNIQDSPLYEEDIMDILKNDIPFTKLFNSNIIVSGSTGLIGTLFVDVLMSLNRDENAHIRIIALCRNYPRAVELFAKYKDNPFLTIISHDINNPLESLPIVDTVDYIVHMASNTHPLDYSQDPIGTITANVIGTKNMLDFAVEHKTKRFLFTSSNEIYGENRGDVTLFDENYCGYINSNTLRAGYPESKRCGESLCQAYKKQKNLDISIARLTRSYGATLKHDDSKAMSQFLKKAVAGEDIVLKSQGDQLYSYTYVSDAVAGLFYVLLCGKNGEAYNIADGRYDKRLKEIAEILATLANTKVIYDLPTATEKEGFSKVVNAQLSGEKIGLLGWKMKYDIESGLQKTYALMKELNNYNDESSTNNA